MPVVLNDADRADILRDTRDVVSKVVELAKKNPQKYAGLVSAVGEFAERITALVEQSDEARANDEDPGTLEDQVLEKMRQNDRTSRTSVQDRWLAAAKSRSAQFDRDMELGKKIAAQWNPHHPDYRK